MEQTGISIIQTSAITASTAGKSKSVGIPFNPSSSIQTATKKFKIPWLSNLMREDASGWKTLCIAVSEAIGTAILVFVGCTGCIGSLGVHPNVMQISLAFGLGAMIAIQVITPVQLMYTAQGAGDSFCMTDIHTDLTTLQGAMAEVLATGLLVFFACGLWDCRNAANTDSAPMRLGFCITVLCLIFIPYTGCSLNPARTLGPAIWNGYWTNHWVFWIGPIGGAIVSSLLYRCLFLCKTTESE
ncbi:aquaporin AQPAe.a-like isoform X2 [Bombus pyrosoma]|uniref:aquaporin AQPAe.a-like isoform X2 n=1 Tax=Bombus pyrosoma TaxID=396416 RepID=UPI001CB97EB4|nr:aquaporin AQPAe.a-like isoform X2 [Bombus pyrosoma]